MSGADAARDQLRQTLLAHQGPITRATTDYQQALAEALAQLDLVRAFIAAGDVILAAEHLKQVAEEAAQAMRKALPDQMADVGCFRAGSDTVTLSLRQRPPTLSIGGMAQIPSTFMRQPPPQPDRAMLIRALNSGTLIKDVALITHNDYTLTITVKSK